ncbi:MAG: hypothetical protein QNJ98_01105 [Planctomycetota bacterium]|nr:hypothetical protein [Planctomycetota bacterium]
MSIRAHALLLASLLLVACGGGGAGDPPTTPASALIVAGEYRFIAMESVNDDARAVTGVMTPVGQAFELSHVWFASQGSAGASQTAFPIPFTVFPDRLFALADDGLQGRITPDGMLATAVSVTPATESALYVLVRHQPTPLLSDLAGSWKAISFGRAGPTYEGFASIADVSIDANGQVTYTSVTSSLDGEIDPLPQVLQPDQLVVLAGGTIALQRAGALARRGGVSEDGNLILFAGDMASGKASIHALVRKWTASPSDFVGAYGTAALVMDGPLPRAVWGPLFKPAPPSDATLLRYYLYEGESYGPWDVTLGVGVLQDGELTTVGPGINAPSIYRGMVAAGGAYAFDGVGISPGAGEMFRVLIR